MQGHVVEVSSDAHDIACKQTVANEEHTMQETVVGLLREHLSHQLASENKPPQLSEAPNAAEVHNSLACVAEFKRVQACHIGVNATAFSLQAWLASFPSLNPYSAAALAAAAPLRSLLMLQPPQQARPSQTGMSCFVS